jgi:hypothetical protein
MLPKFWNRLTAFQLRRIEAGKSSTNETCFAGPVAEKLKLVRDSSRSLLVNWAELI